MESLLLVDYPKTVIRPLCANELSFWQMSSRFSVTMEPHCALKTRTHLLRNRSRYHHNANDRFGMMKVDKPLYPYRKHSASSFSQG